MIKIAAYRCKRCGYIYIDDKQDKPFESCDEINFKCPRCRCSKKLFEKLPNS